MRIKINSFLPDVGNDNNERKTERQTDRTAEGGEGGRKEEAAASQDPSTWWLTLAISRAYLSGALNGGCCLDFQPSTAQQHKLV